MPFSTTDISGLLLFDPVVLKDDRGYFFESYNQQVYEKEGLDYKFVQDNQSFSKYGVVRGLHYQLNPHAQVKLVRVLSGKILDVAVDIRRGSPTFGKYLAFELSSENKRQLLIPGGFAHGFSVLSETAEILYKCNGFYDKASEAGIRYDDPALGIDWQIPADKALVSPKDAALPGLDACSNNFDY